MLEQLNEFVVEANHWYKAHGGMPYFQATRTSEELCVARGTSQMAMGRKPNRLAPSEHPDPIGFDHHSQMIWRCLVGPSKPSERGAKGKRAWCLGAWGWGLWWNGGGVVVT